MKGRGQKYTGGERQRERDTQRETKQKYKVEGFNACIFILV